jgi:thioredoxin reductase (NADPH)
LTVKTTCLLVAAPRSVYYDATQIEAQVCGPEEVAIVGGGNSAGQAAVFLSTHARHVHLIIRGPGLADSMSRYLISLIEASRQITLRTWTEIEALEGNGHLQYIRCRQTQTGATETHPIQHLFVMTGASPDTAWLEGCLVVDDKHFIRTGADLADDWPLKRAPHLLETT